MDRSILKGNSVRGRRHGDEVVLPEVTLAAAVPAATYGRWALGC